MPTSEVKKQEDDKSSNSKDHQSSDATKVEVSTFSYEENKTGDGTTKNSNDLSMSPESLAHDEDDDKYEEGIVKKL